MELAKQPKHMLVAILNSFSYIFNFFFLSLFLVPFMRICEIMGINKVLNSCHFDVGYS